jgi:carbon-monoxide dehydrogenase small subunit
MSRMPITLTVNGERYDLAIEPRRLLSDVLREECGLTGTHVGCEHGVCGACTVLIDGAPARACLTFAVQMEGHAIRTIESSRRRWRAVAIPAGVARGTRSAMRLLHAGHRHDHRSLAERQPGPGRCGDPRRSVRPHLCRCTGYQPIIAAVKKRGAERCGRRDG